jgi:hypothetical protein
VIRTSLWLVVGAVVFVAITFLEQVPILGWLGGVVSIAAWIALTRELVSDRVWSLMRGGIGIAWAAILGGFTGFVGALTAWLAQTGSLFGFTTQPGDRFGAAFGFVGASLGLIYWPVVGVMVCAVAALTMTGRRSESQ